MLRVRTLQQRFALFLLVPVAVLLFAMGFVGFFYARDSLLKQWAEAAILRLQRAAHDVDMRLSEPKRWLQIYHETSGDPYADHVRQWVLDQLRELEGVARVQLTTENELPSADYLHLHRGRQAKPKLKDRGMGGRGNAMHFHRARIAEITPPRYDSVMEHETVSIISELHDVNGKAIGRVEVAIRFEHLIKNILATGWWQSQRSFLVDNSGNVLMCTDHNRRRLGDTDDPLELATLAAMRESSSGTLLGEGRPPHEVSGYYRLQEAPWTLVLVAPGRQILAPIGRFRSYYAFSGALFILLILFTIRLVTNRTVSSIKDVSSAAERVAQGNYDSLPPIKSRDEVGQLIDNFNTMVLQLQERLKLKEALGLAKEVQQNLLPGKAPEIKGFDIAGQSIYCDETGGDFYDFLPSSELGNGRIGVVVGDVTGHGISAALLMTTVRALLRSRITQPGSLGQVITDVNRLLSIDTSETGDFMTLFFLLIDPVKGEVRWVRAGHDPAIIYDPPADSFRELHGSGIALGVDDTFSFQEYRQEGWARGQVILLGTDGIWETENQHVELFGKDRLREVIRQNKDCSSQEILEAITSALNSFRQAVPQKDDVTMVVIKKL